MLTALQDIELEYTVRPSHGPDREVSYPFMPDLGQDYFHRPLTVASFLTGPSDYDTASDELYCPCGDTLEWPDGSLGTAIQVAEKHIQEKHR